MAGYPNGEPRLCMIGRAAQKLGCLPKNLIPRTQYFYPIAIPTVDGGFGYSDDVKYKHDPCLPPWQPDEPKPQMTPYVPTYRHESPRVPKTPKKTPVAQTVPLSTLPLPVNTLPVHTPATTCVTLHDDLPPVHPAAQMNQTPYLAQLSVVPQTPRQNAVADTILHDLGHITPTQYIWNTPHGALTYTPAPASHLLLPNPLADRSPCSPGPIDIGDGNDGPAGLGVIPSRFSSDSSDSSSDCSDPDHRSGIILNPFVSNYQPLGETPIKWNVSEPADMARHVLDGAGFLANMGAPATNPPANTLRIEFYFVDQPGAQWNWEPILVKKARPIRVVDLFHEIHRYFQRQLTYPEWDVINSYGKRNSRIVAKSWRERVASQLDTEAQSRVFHGGLKRVDCLGSAKTFAGLWVEDSRVMLGLRT